MYACTAIRSGDHTASKTALQKQIGHFVKWLTAFGLIAFAVIWLINFIHSRDVFHSLLLGLTLAMSAVPEEIPVAFSAFMALGSAKMVKLGIIAREAQTIENLGAVNVMLTPWVIFISVGFLLTINMVPFLRDIFQLFQLTMFHYFICIIVSPSLWVGLNYLKDGEEVPDSRLTWVNKI